MKNLFTLITISLLGLCLACGNNSNNDPCCQDYQVTSGTTPANFDYSNIITPNGDGLNDYLFIENDSLNTVQLQIFDDNDLIYSSSNYQNNFSGLDNTGSTINDGNYETKVVIGTFSIEYTLTIIRSASQSGSCKTNCKAHDPGDPLLI
jgi:hypothetical protein